MQKVAAFKTEDGKIFENANAAHDHEIEKQVVELTAIAGVPKEFSLYIAGFITDNKDKLLNILEKPKL